MHPVRLVRGHPYSLSYIHIIAFGPVLVVPCGHGEQPRSAVSVGGVETNWLSVQLVHGVHELALVVVLNPVSQ